MNFAAAVVLRGKHFHSLAGVLDFKAAVNHRRDEDDIRHAADVQRNRIETGGQVDKNVTEDIARHQDDICQRFGRDQFGIFGTFGAAQERDAFFNLVEIRRERHGRQ